ncbi:hypothetical protein T36_0514 [Helicobacter cinaedi]|uniref:lysozyme inhibitor LprI family protein n=1 Tax=Helicobacter cinaedi TaxID=213 RepID=UPI001F30F263|nr:hypothetical protein [Helicobacter cinaedi]BDB64067.1 hypothetical protein T36_0514 [Helicobacter cinaedi]
MIHKLSIFFYISFIFINLVKAESAQVAKPSFDCAKASTKVEKMICGDESGELQRLDRLYSKLYFSVLKSIPKDTKEGQETRKSLKRFNKMRMAYRDRQICPYLAINEEAQQEMIEYERPTRYQTTHYQFSGTKLETQCIKRNYLATIALLAYNMNLETFKKEFRRQMSNYSLNETKMFLIKGLQKYNLYNQFFLDEDKEKIVNVYLNYCKQILGYIVENRVFDTEVDIEELDMKEMEKLNRGINEFNGELDTLKELKNVHNISTCAGSCEFDINRGKAMDDFYLMLKNNTKLNLEKDNAN